ncbi:MAG: DUF952 domain-containing protein [Turicibacter sp.]|nr:DUF952 domain-containing protein [Turicibacter sp.]
MIILHCVSEKVWQTVADKTYYETPSLTSEGFIHCSEPEHFHKVADYVFKDVKEQLLLLCLDTTLLEPEIRWEDGGSGTLYPHLYGALNTNAIIKIFPFLRDENGAFMLNPELEVKS